MGHLKFEHTKPYEDRFWAENRLNLLRAFVKELLPEKKLLVLDDDTKIPYDLLILGTGSRPKFFNWPGQELQGVQGFYSLQDLQQLEQQAPSSKQCKRSVVVGGGLIGIEVAEMLKSRDIPVTLLVREPAFWNNVLPNCDSEHLNRHILEHHIDLRLSIQLQEILGDENGRVCGIVTDSGEQIDCDLVVLSTGVTPNIAFLKESGLELDQGILVNEFLETSVPGIYAIGDCAQLRNPLPGRRATEAVWYVGRAMGQAVAQTVCGTPTKYTPGTWFNSAKFLDIEYQTYGLVPADVSREANQQVFHWKHDKSDSWLTLCFNAVNQEFIGVNVFGIRLRHAVLDAWLSAKTSVTTVIEGLDKAFFNPELTQNYVPLIQQAFLEHQKNKQ